MLKKIVLFTVVLCFSFIAMAQQRQITGTVVDVKGYPIPGATVLAEGTQNGTATDLDGKFTLMAPANGTLQVSFIGYATEKVAISGKTSIQVVLKEDAESIEEVVVVGYGSGKRVGNIVGSISTVSAKEIAGRPTANIGDALQGKVPGLQIFNTTGEPQSTVSMKLRGSSSLTLATAPLYILDGVPVQGTVFTQINPQDIENISILKDASATAIYGSRAANGVIYITTKKGRKGEKPQISVRAQYGISMLTNYNMDMMNSEELIRFEEMCRPALKTDPAYQAKKAFILGNGIDFDWTDYLFDKAAPLVQADASLRGATEKTSYYVSLGYYSEQGTAKVNSGLDRFTFRTNLDMELARWLKFGANVALTYSKYHTITTGWAEESPILQAVTGVPYYTPYELIQNEDGTISYGDVQLIYPWAANGQHDLNEYYKHNTNDQAQANLMGQTYFTVTPLEGLTLRATQAIEAFDFTNSAIARPDYGLQAGITPSRRESFQRYYQLLSTNTVEYRTDFGTGTHSLTALLGHESMVKNSKSFNAKGEGYTDDRILSFGSAVNITNWAGGKSESASNSFFANFNYNYNGKYFVDASVRTDGSSLFGADHRYATFFSVGAMWKMKDENFLTDVTWVNDLNLKVSYGTTGNGGLSPYEALGLVGTGSSYNGRPGWGISQVPNKDLTWETVETFNIGVNGRLADRLNFDIQFYNRQSKDLIMDLPFSGTTGLSSGIGNIASMRNRGLDLELSLDLIHTKNIYWNIRGNVNYNRNEITKLYQNLDELKFPSSGQIYKVGESSTVVWLQKFAGVDPMNGEPMWYDLNGNLTKNFSDDIRQLCGMDSTAPWSGGFSTNFSWKGLGLVADFSWIGERWIFIDERYYTRNPNELLQNSNFEREMLNIWTTPGQKTNIPKFGTPYRADTSIYSNAAFLRLKNLSVSYTFPQQWMDKTGFLAGLKVFATGRNLWTITKFDGYDPEVGYSNAVQGMYPNSRQFVFGTEFTF